jgi:hypothetical protein
MAIDLLEQFDAAAKEIQRQLDFDLLSSVFVESGWTKIVLTPMSGEKSEAIDQWLDTECQGQYTTMGLAFVFERRQDAAMFALTFV